MRTVTGVDESGGEARAYLCDNDVVVKTQRPHRLRPRTSLEKEAFILDQLAAHASLPLPRVLGYGREPDVEYIVMSRIPGVPLEAAPLAGAARAGALEALGATLRRIHDVDQSTMETSALIPGDRSGADLRDRLASSFENLTADLAPDGRLAGELDLREVAVRCLKGLPASPRLVTLHSNPGPEHCFVDAESGQFTGLIDFGDAYRSHPALDVRSWFSLDDSRHMLAGYRDAGPQLPDDFDQVWRAGIIVTELRLASRGHRGPSEVADVVRRVAEDGAER
ncbi:MAG: phosphotransferase family protein [Acidimicrobiales bacterium]